MQPAPLSAQNPALPITPETTPKTAKTRGKKMSKHPNQNSKAIAKPLTEQELSAQVALTGNLAGLTPEQQMLYYERYCQHLGLDPITRPFDLVTTYDDNGVAKTVLYANASCSAQLADKRQVSYGKPEKEYDPLLGVLTIRVEAFVKIADGRFRGTHRSGVVHIDGLKGKRLENAIKKAETQAHRRATLALCGVAMPDESEIEDIPNALTTKIQPVTIDSAIGGLYDRIGSLLTEAGCEDSSGARRFCYDWLQRGAFQAFAQQVKKPETEIRAEFGHLCVPAPTEAEHETIAEAAHIMPEQNIEHVTPPEPEPVLTQKEQQIKADLKASRDKHISTPTLKTDPVPLAVLLTAAQQKASDAVMIAIREHKKDKATVLHLIGQYLGREVTRSADLTDAEAEKVYTYLQTLGSQWSAEKECEDAAAKDEI
jgi:hypothetical protein